MESTSPPAIPDLDLEFNHLLKLNESSRVLRMMRQLKICIILDMHQVFLLDGKDLTIFHRLAVGICLASSKALSLGTEVGFLIKEDPNDWFFLDRWVKSRIDVSRFNSLKIFHPTIKWQADVLVSPTIKKLTDANTLKRLVSNRIMKLNIPVEDFGFEDCAHSLKMLGA